MSDLITSGENPFALAAASMPVVKADDSLWADAVASTSWMPSLRLVSAKSTKLTNPPASLKAGNFYLIKNSNGVGSQDFGKSVVIIPVASRYKAVEEVTVEKKTKFVNYFDPKSPDYIRVRETAQGAGLTGCFHGPEFLVWVDGAGDLGGGWAHLHCSNKTARNTATEMQKYVGKNTTLKLVSYMAEGPKFQWEAYSAEPTIVQLQALPTVEDVRERMQKFSDEAKLGKTLETPTDAPVQ